MNTSSLYDELDWPSYEMGEKGYFYDIYKDHQLATGRNIMPDKVIVAPIETKYDGTLFRSRTEARWAVFFDEAGIRYEYEKEGFPLPSGHYLPDFWLPELEMWLEVKGKEPTTKEVQKCQELVDATKAKFVLLAIGAPRATDQIIVLSRSAPTDDADERMLVAERRKHRFYFAEDRRNEGEFWLVCGADEACFSIGPVVGPDHGRYPVIFGPTARGYEAARKARFW